mgnify:CR=1 FL=1
MTFIVINTKLHICTIQPHLHPLHTKWDIQNMLKLKEMFV